MDTDNQPETWGEVIWRIWDRFLWVSSLWDSPSLCSYHGCPRFYYSDSQASKTKSFYQSLSCPAEWS